MHEEYGCKESSLLSRKNLILGSWGVRSPIHSTVSFSWNAEPRTNGPHRGRQILRGPGVDHEFAIAFRPGCQVPWPVGHPEPLGICQQCRSRMYHIWMHMHSINKSAVVQLHTLSCYHLVVKLNPAAILTSRPFGFYAPVSVFCMRYI